MKHAIAIVLAAFCLTACAEQDSRPQYQPCPHPFDGESCPDDDCWPVVQNSVGYPECDASELLLGCASGPQELPFDPRGEQLALGPFVYSRTNGLLYLLKNGYSKWFDANASRFCAEGSSDCPDPDPDIVAACEAPEN